MLEVLLKEGGDRATLLLRPGRHRVVAVQAVRAVGRGHVLRQRAEPAWRVIARMDCHALAEQEDRHMICRGPQVGGPYYITSYRWGYGWPYGRGYTPLSAPERDALAVEEQQR